ncbi:MAG: DUF4157 domain-containing protein [Nibricoccus sp.]
MNSTLAIAAGEQLPGERWRSLALAQARKVRVGHPWVEISQKLLTRHHLIEPRGCAARRGSTEESTRAQVSARLTAGPSPQAETSPHSTPTSTDPVVRVTPAAQKTLPPSMQAMVEQLLQTRLPPIKIRHDQVSDQLARRHQADALVRGDEIHFRRGAYNPATPAGRGLIAHEATHLAWSRGLRPPAASSAAMNMAELEEQLALEVEKHVLHRQPSPLSAPRESTRANRSPGTAEASRSDARSAVRTALTNRELSAEESEPAPVAGISENQLRTLKEELYRTLLDRLRSEFERGG